MICPISRNSSHKISFVAPHDQGVSSQIPRSSHMDMIRDQDLIIYSLGSTFHHFCHLWVTIPKIRPHSDQIIFHRTSSISVTISRYFVQSHQSRSTSSILIHHFSPIATTLRSGEMRMKCDHSVIYLKTVCHPISPGLMPDFTRWNESSKIRDRSMFTVTGMRVTISNVKWIKFLGMICFYEK